MGRKQCSQIRIGTASFERHLLLECKFDPAYQRELDEKRAGSIGEAFSPKLFGVPVLSKRSNGDLFVVDGQHRVVGGRKAGLDGKEFLFQVISGLSLQQEAALFVELQRERVAVRAYDNYRARLVAADPTIVEIEHIVTKARLRTGKAPAPHVVCAVKALEAVHDRFANLPVVLPVLRQWSDDLGGSPTAFDGHIIRHVSRFLYEFPSAVPETLAAKLTVYGVPERLLGTIKRNHDSFGHGEPIADIAVSLLVNIYNRRNRNKLTLADRGQPVESESEAA